MHRPTPIVLPSPSPQAPEHCKLALVEALHVGLRLRSTQSTEEDLYEKTCSHANRRYVCPGHFRVGRQRANAAAGRGKSARATSERYSDCDQSRVPRLGSVLRPGMGTPVRLLGLPLRPLLVITHHARHLSARPPSGGLFFSTRSRRFWRGRRTRCSSE
jgi:hypothetical protein